jgi:hypothetical protein
MPVERIGFAVGDAAIIGEVSRNRSGLGEHITG